MRNQTDPLVQLSLDNYQLELASDSSDCALDLPVKYFYLLLLQKGEQVSLLKNLLDQLLNLVLLEETERRKIERSQILKNSVL